VVAMARILLMVGGALLALYVVFSFVVPAVFALLKFALIIALIGVVVFAVVSFVGKSSSR